MWAMYMWGSERGYICGRGPKDRGGLHVDGGRAT